MMTNTEALQAILSRIGTFTGTKKTNIQLANNPLVGGKPYEPPKGEIWAKVTVKNAGSFISAIGDATYSHHWHRFYSVICAVKFRYQ